MGILTSAYIVEKRLFDLIIEDSNNLDIIEYPDEKAPEELGFDKNWNPIDHDFDKSWEDLLYLLRGTGFENVADILEYLVERIDYKYSDIYVRFLINSDVKELYKEIKNTSESKLKQICLEKGNITDYNGDVFDEWKLSYVLSGYDKFIDFIKKATKNENTIFFIST